MKKILFLILILLVSCQRNFTPEQAAKKSMKCGRDRVK
jgi:hypothetical protein